VKLEKVCYAKLNSRQKEIFNFQKVAGLLSEYGFNCIKLADDWQGADFLAYHVDGNTTLKVQLKSRIVVSESYRGKNLYLAFPIQNAWYLIEHDDLLVLVDQHTDWLSTHSWNNCHGYSSASPNRKLVTALEPAKL